MNAGLINMNVAQSICNAHPFSGNRIQLLLKHMGADESAAYERGTKVRYRTLEQGTPQNNSRIISRSIQHSKLDNSFATPPINNSYSRNVKDIEEDSQPQEDDASNIQYNAPKSGRTQRRYQSLDVSVEESRARYRSAPKKSETDRILQQLSKKNESLRKELKTISDQLSTQLTRKKFVPKKKNGLDEDEQNNVEVNLKLQVGLKRELENAYKQIDMYKRTLQGLKGKQEGDTADTRLSRLSNDIVTMDGQIEKYIKKIEGVKRIKHKQDGQIVKDINEDLKDGVITYKRDVDLLKVKLKELLARDRQREANYKKQQAYLCDLERKARELNGEYFPDLNNTIKKQIIQHRTAASEKERVNPKEFNQVRDQALKLRQKHAEYYKKIDNLLKFKNRGVEEQNDFKEQILYKERIIEALKIKIEALKKLLNPTKKALFGYGGSSYEGSDMNSEYNDTPSEIERQLQEELSQDQFDIKHLIANIPKPIRKRPQELSNGYSSDGISNENQNNKKGGGMIVTSEKAQPKKWGGVSARTEQRGKNFKGELQFEDRAQFDEDVQPLIVGVNVWVNKNNSIVGIQAIYLNKQELRYGVKSCDAADGMIRRFDLQSPDFLKNLTMTINSDGFIESMSLYSKQGKVGKFGNKREVDENINFGMSSNQRPYMFFGASTLFEGEPRLNIFGMEICAE